MRREERDPYSLLGLRREASASDINRAYRRAARATHPDGRPGDPSAGERFNAVTAAYETLRDPRRRAAYDEAHPPVRSGAHFRGVRVASPRFADADTTLGFSFRPTGPGAPLRAGPVTVVPPAGPRSASPFRADDEIAQVAEYLSRLLRAGW
jgi:curved DNA-binding protein CbpA